MGRRYTRRATLAALGSVAVGGCVDEDDRSESFWSEPPSFDDDGLETATETPTPARPDPIPVAVADDRVEQFASRVETLLAPVPEQLTADDLPNGAIRTAILEARQDARDDVERLRRAEYALDAASAAADACERAARAAAIWAHVSTNHELGALPIDPAAVRTAQGSASDSIPDVATGPAAGAVAYAPIEHWLRASSPAPSSGASLAASEDPLETGDQAADVERCRTEIAVGRHLRDRYVASLDHPRPVESTLTAAVETLAPVTSERFEAAWGEDSDDSLRPPRVDAYLSSDGPYDAPGRELLGEQLRTVPHGYAQPIAWPAYETEWPALALRTTHSALAHLDALDEIRTRIEDGDSLFPDDAATVEAARDDAIDAVENRLDADEPLEQWQAWQFVPEIETADEALVPGADLREIAASHTTYVWVATFAAQVPDATATVEDALGQ